MGWKSRGERGSWEAVKVRGCDSSTLILNGLLRTGFESKKTEARAGLEGMSLTVCLESSLASKTHGTMTLSSSTTSTVTRPCFERREIRLD